MAIPSEGPFVVLHPPVITDPDGPFLCLLAQMRTDIRALIVISARPCPTKGGYTGSYRPAQLPILPFPNFFRPRFMRWPCIDRAFSAESQVSLHVTPNTMREMENDDLRKFLAG